MPRFFDVAGGLWTALAAPLPLPTLTLTADQPPPRIDGRLDEALWQRAPGFEAFQLFRPDSAPDAGPYRTRVQVLLMLSPEQALRVLHLRGHSERRAEPGLAGALQRSRTTTLTWLARAGGAWA